jgi:hypothetical protein
MQVSAAVSFFPSEHTRGTEIEEMQVPETFVCFATQRRYENRSFRFTPSLRFFFSRPTFHTSNTGNVKSTLLLETIFTRRSTVPSL